jgi:hypothetical protein
MECVISQNNPYLFPDTKGNKLSQNMEQTDITEFAMKERENERPASGTINSQ